MALPKPTATLPSTFIIRTGKFVWTTMWHLMMSRLAPRNEAGEYLRPASEFRHQVSNENGARYAPEPNRYHLIVGMSCPWAHRTLIVRELKGLQEAISLSIVIPSPLEGGWVFETDKDGCHSLAEFYQKLQPGNPGRSTVPVLWDSKTQTIVNNESADIIVLLNSAFDRFAKHADRNFYPADLQAEIDRWNQKIYAAVNNGVYRCGFAQTQAAYDRAMQDLFGALDEIDCALKERRYLCGDRLTLADIRLFTTLFRFDAAYHGLFKCNLRRIQDYPHLGGYLRDLYQFPGIANTCDLAAVKRDYYGNLFPLNPGGVIPSG
ncbi:MAG: glutathione S-transferase family protein, partial [Cyanobacteria bacterium J06641_5]